MFDFNLKNYGFLQLIVCIILNIAGLIFIQSSVGERIYSPGHPDADANGYIRASNVNAMVDMADAIIHRGPDS